MQALDGLIGVVCVADDIIIHGKDLKEHDDNLEAFLRQCKEVDIRLNKEKLDLRTNAITFLGHRISSKGLEPDPAKVQAITQMDPPTNVRQLRTFIGMVNYMAKFLPKLYLKPLTNLTKKEVPWNWSTAENDAFENIKSQLTTAPVLAFYNPSKELTLENDVSDYDSGSALQQEGKPVAFASRTLTETECRYLRLLIRNQCGSHVLHGIPNPLAFQQNYCRYDGPSKSGSFFTLSKPGEMLFLLFKDTMPLQGLINNSTKNFIP